MISILASTLITSVYIPTTEYQTIEVPEKIARYCAKVVGIPYASDNFTDVEWGRFKDCVQMEMQRTVSKPSTVQ